MTLFTKQRIQLLLFLLYFLVASKFFPSFQLALFVPFLALLADSTRWVKTALFGIFLGITIDLISFAYPIGFYTTTFVLVSLVMYKVKGSIALYKPIPLFAFLYFSTLLTTLILMIFSTILGKPLRYSGVQAALDFFLLSAIDTAIAMTVLLFLPFLFKNKFFIEIIRKRGKKRSHG